MCRDIGRRICPNAITVPLKSNHRYSVLTPQIIRLRWLLPIAAFLLGLFLIAIAARFFIRKDKENKAVFKHTLHDALIILSTLYMVLFLLPWNNIFNFDPRIDGLNSILPLFQRNIVSISILAAAAITLYCLRGTKQRLRTVFLLIITSVNLFAYFLPEWYCYGVRTDSASYIAAHSASSIRTVGTSRFIEDVMTITQQTESLDFWRSDEGTAILEQNEDRLMDERTVPSRGLITIVRAQKICLGIIFLVSVFFMANIFSPGFALLFVEIVLGGGFLGVYNSYIMSEVLSQSMILLAVTLFAVYIVTKNNACFPLVAIVSAEAILIRPSNIFLAILVLIAMIVLLKRKSSSRTIMLIIGLGVFLWMVSSPSREIYKQYKQFIWMPVSGYAEIGRALPLLTQDDIDAFQDQNIKDFLTGAQGRIEKLSAEKDQLNQNDYVWEIAVPQAEQMGYDQITCSRLFNAAAPAIFGKHMPELIIDIREQAQLALERTRIHIGFANFIILFIAAFCFSFIRISSVSMTGLLFTMLHMTHLFISIINQPERRYIYSTEIIFILGCVIILFNLFRRGTRIETRD